MRISLLRATLLAAFAACASLAAPDEDSAAEAAAALPPRAERGVHEPDVVEAAAWAVEQLRELSDSGVYTTLSLARIAAAASQPGVFHDNLFLGLELARCVCAVRVLFFCSLFTPPAPARQQDAVARSDASLSRGA